METEIIKKMKKIISTKKAPKAIGPYSQAILSGNTLYCSGQIAINPETGELLIDNITNNQLLNSPFIKINEEKNSLLYKAISIYDSLSINTNKIKPLLFWFLKLV